MAIKGIETTLYILFILYSISVRFWLSDSQKNIRMLSLKNALSKMSKEEMCKNMAGSFYCFIHMQLNQLALITLS